MTQPIAHPPHFARYWKLLSKMDLVALSSSTPSDACEPVEIYAHCRAHVILGQYEHALSALSKYPQKEHHPLIGQLIQAQIDAFHCQNREAHLTTLTAARDSDSTELYMQAEVEFTIGFLHAQLCQFNESLDHYERAAELFKKVSLPRQAGVAYFNLSVNANHLGLKDLNRNHKRAFSEICEETRDPALLALQHRLEGYRAVDTENFEFAESCFELARDLFLKTGRKRDAFNAECFLAYIYLKLQCRLKLDNLFLRTLGSPQEANTSIDENRARLNWFRRIQSHAFMSLTQAESLFQEIKQAELGGISSVLLSDLILERLLLSKSYEAVLVFYKKMLPLTHRLEQSISLVDIRYYAIVAYFSLGMRTQAARLLSQYELDAKTSESDTKRNKVMEVRRLFWNVEGDHKPDPVESINCSLDSRLMHLSIGDRTIDLSKQQVLLRLLIALFENPDGIQYDQLFKLCYADDFDPILHLSRFNSLIGRAKAIFGRPGAIIWRDGILQLSPLLKPHLVYTTLSQGFRISKRQFNLAKRLNQVECMIASRRDVVAISEIESTFSESRRTLQADLQTLVKKNRLVRVGRGRATTYRAAAK